MRRLLAYAAASRVDNPEEPGTVAAPNRADERQLKQVIDAGLGPLLHRAWREEIVDLPPGWREILQAADLTAQVRHGNVIDAAIDVIDICNSIQVPVTLLKGISISDQHYAFGHERAMGDIDILVPEDCQESVEAALMLNGYARSDYQMDEGSCHGAPLIDNRRGVWVEVHTALFPREAALQTGRLFSSSYVSDQSVASTFHGRSIRRLTNELQLVYIASYWLRDLSGNRIHPSFLPPLFDAIYLLKASGRTMDWKGLLACIDNETAMASLYVLLAYLSRSGLFESPPDIVPRLAAGQDIVGSMELRLILSIIETYLVRDKAPLRLFRHLQWQHRTVTLRTLDTLLTPGSHAAKLLRIPWNIIFPPYAKDRYSFAFHWTRASRLLGAQGSDASMD